VVSVRFANFNITVLGEVARPATYVVPNEKVSILDAIGMAGDLTIYGKRENVLLIRDSLGIKKMMRFDLNSTSTLLSPYFYLRQGDVVYVEPAKSKIAASDAVKTRNITLLGAGLSLLIVIFSRF
jgi:polysaccharide export outer membrane protein